MIKKTVFIFLFAISVFAQSSSQVANELKYLLQDPFFNSCQIGVTAYNLTKREIIFRHNDRLLLRPASNEKIVTTATALRFLGSEYNFKTVVKYNGNIENKTLKGDLYFVGGFDPDFTTEDLDTLIMQLKANGIENIDGNIYADVSNMDSLFWGNGWMWDDDPYSDFPYMTPLVINDASVQVAITPTNIGEKANITLIPNSKYFKFTNNVYTVDNDTSDLTVSRDWITRSDSLILEGGFYINAEPDTTKINLVHTNDYFLFLTKELLKKNSISFNGEVGISESPESAKIIAIKKRPFSNVIINLNKTSDNLSAEMTLRALAFEHLGKHASAKKGVILIDSLISEIGLNPHNYRIVDGSGVSHYNLISVELLNEILIYFYDSYPELFEVLYNSFPIAGIDGTLKHRMEHGHAFNNVHAKTGTLSGVSSLTGYLTAKNGDLISFSINTQNFVGSARTARDFQDKICEILANIE